MYEVEKKYRGEGIISMSFFSLKITKNLDTGFWIQGDEICQSLYNKFVERSQQTDRQTDSLFRLIHTVHRLSTNCITKYVTCIYIFAKQS